MSASGPTSAPGPLPDPRPYVGRFAPSPTGPLHAGSLVAALASRLDALAHGGRWLLRIEDVDTPRTVPGAARDIVDTLAAFGFEPQASPMVQSTRGDAYAQALSRLQAMSRVYPCACTRKEIADSLTRAGQARTRHGELVYPGTCRHVLPPGRAPRAWRLRVDETIAWTDRNGTHHEECLPEEVGDFVLRRADGLWAYQLAVVVDDAAQAVTDVVRGEDLAGSTARQILLQRLLSLPTPRYLHVPVVTDAHGEKLSKQTGATALDRAAPLPALERAMTHLGLPATGARSLAEFWARAPEAWARSRWM